MMYVCITVLLLLIILGFIVYRISMELGYTKSQIEILQKKRADEQKISKIKNEIKANLDNEVDIFE